MNYITALNSLSKMNFTSFVSDFIAEFASNVDYYTNIADLLEFTLNEFVSTNSIEVNKKIISDFSGDIFNAINLYREHLGEVEHLYSSMDVFYQQLAFISLFIKFYPEIESALSHFNETVFINEIVDEYQSYPDCYDNITDLLDVSIDDYVSNNSFAINKQLIHNYIGNITSALNLYMDHLGYLDIINTPIAVIYEKLAYISLFLNLYPKIATII